jgi:hypothetical protein
LIREIRGSFSVAFPAQAHFAFEHAEQQGEVG